MRILTITFNKEINLTFQRNNHLWIILESYNEHSFEKHIKEIANVYNYFQSGEKVINMRNKVVLLNQVKSSNTAYASYQYYYL